MDQNAGVLKNEEGLKNALVHIKKLQHDFENAYIGDKSMVFNTALVNALELENMLILSEIIVQSALERNESRGGHFRTDFPQRDDTNWLKHTIIRRTEQGPLLEYRPVKITRWTPVERKY